MTAIETRLDQTFRGMAGTVNNDAHNMMTSGDYYVTPEICRELKHIGSGIDHIRLDHDFLRSSREWGNKFDPSERMADKQGAIMAAERTAGRMYDLKNNMTSRQIHGMQDNQARATHQTAMTSLRESERELGPYAHQSVDRVKQFCDHIGVTDRYTGYRANLNRGNRDPVRLGFSWLDNQKKNAYNGTLNVGWQPRTGGSTNTSVHPKRMAQSAHLPHSQLVDVSRPPVTSVCSAPARSIQERCGINTKFPGRSEYTDRYSRPPQNQPTQNYIVNPAPDYSMTGRPMMTVQVDPSNTEYHSRYEWPDASRMEKFPWLRT